MKTLCPPFRFIVICFFSRIVNSVLIFIDETSIIASVIERDRFPKLMGAHDTGKYFIKQSREGKCLRNETCKVHFNLLKRTGGL